MFGILTSLQLVLLRGPHVMDQHKKHQQWQVAGDRLVGAIMRDAAGVGELGLPEGSLASRPLGLY